LPRITSSDQIGIVRNLKELERLYVAELLLFENRSRIVG